MKDRICNVLIVLGLAALVVGAGAREYLIHNGRLTSDMNADGHSITNLPGGFFPVESVNGMTGAVTVPPTDLAPAIAHADEALASFAETGAVARAAAYGTTERWTDSHGRVWEKAYSDWAVEYDDPDMAYYGVRIVATGQGEGAYWIPYVGDSPAGVAKGNADSTEIVWFNAAITDFKATRTFLGATNLVGRVALTNDIPDVSGYATPQQATNAATAVADTKISTNNAAFVAAVTNCPVSHQGGGGADWPIGDFGQYGTIGAIIAALVAASTWLKSHLRYELHDVVLTGGAGTLLDRAGNRVVVTGDTTLTLPAAVPGYCRDFLVRLEISGSTVPTITFQGQGSEAPNGADEITYETDGDEFPVPDEAGTWSYSFTENCVAHKFAVSLKKVNEVAQAEQ